MDNKDKEALLSYVKVTHVCFIIKKKRNLRDYWQVWPRLP